MKRIVCFHSDIDFGMTTHLREKLLEDLGGLGPTDLVPEAEGE